MSSSERRASSSNRWRWRKLPFSDLDLLAVNPVAQRLQLAQGGEQLLTGLLEAGFGGRGDGFDLTQPGAIGGHEGGCLIVLGDPARAARRELAERSAVESELVVSTVADRASRR